MARDPIVHDACDQPDAARARSGNAQDQGDDTRKRESVGDGESEQVMKQAADPKQEIVVESVVSDAKDPPVQYKLQCEEIHVEPPRVTHVRYPTTALFERGVKLSRRATYTPSIATAQVHTSMSLQGVAAYQRRATLSSHLDLKAEHGDFDDEVPDPTGDRQWMKQTYSGLRHEQLPEMSNQSDADEPSSSSSAVKSGRRRRLTTAVKSWFK